MKKFAFLLFCMSLFVVVTATAKDDEENTYRYELENYTDRTMADGYIMIKVWNYGKKEKITRQTCMRNAVHGVIFKGVRGGKASGLNKGHAALCPDGYSAHTDYFDNFFNSGDYMQGVQNRYGLHHQLQRPPRPFTEGWYLKGAQFTILKTYLTKNDYKYEKDNLNMRSTSCKCHGILTGQETHHHGGTKFNVVQ